jgi:Rieske Fe-S protein
MTEDIRDTEPTAKSTRTQSHPSTRRDFFAKLTMGFGVLVGYGVLLVQAFLFILPPRKKAKTRKLFVGKVDHYDEGDVRTVYDLQDNPILIKREKSSNDKPVFKAFNTVCPHLGCRVHWEAQNARFFCPCHNGIFNADGVATAGPPAQAKQSLGTVPVIVDYASGRVYLEVKDV